MPSRALRGDALPRAWGLRRRDARFKRSQCVPPCTMARAWYNISEVCERKNAFRSGALSFPSLATGEKDGALTIFCSDYTIGCATGVSHLE